MSGERLVTESTRSRGKGAVLLEYGRLLAKAGRRVLVCTNEGTFPLGSDGEPIIEQKLKE